MGLTLYIDGGSRGNPGPAACGVVIERDEPRETLHEAGYFLGRMTNNMAEYTGLLRGLAIAVKHKPDHLHILSDSELLVRQITGEYRVKSPDLKPLFEKAQSMLLGLEAWSIKHVYREENTRADGLANKAMDAKRDVIEIDMPPDAPAAKPAPASVDRSPAKAPKAAAPPPAAGTAHCTATIEQEPGDRCPAPCHAGTQFAFGPSTPAGLCIYAAAGVLSICLSDRNKTRQETTCLRCGVPIRIQH